MEMDKNQKLDDLFAQARTESPHVSFEKMKGGFLSQVENPSVQEATTETSNLFTIKIWTIMITTIITVAASAYLILGNSSQEENQQFDAEVRLEKMSTTDEELYLEETDDFSFPEMISSVVYVPTFSSTEEIEHVIAPQKTEVSKLDRKLAVFSDSTAQKEQYRFPTLTEEEKKMYAKQKSKMIKQLIKRDKKMYAFIPAGSLIQGSDSISVLPIHMQVSEVTNLQYRTFLFDLLEKGRQSDFMEAKPDQSLWAKDFPEYNQPMVEMYFSHPAYNDYPVNNISRKGAELYCVWLTSQANAVLESKNKPRCNDLRIPTVFEWVYAANGGMKESPYPWDCPYDKNAKGCYLANFNPEGESPNEDGAMHTANVLSYVPNGYGLYCMSGNLAEMVYYSEDKSEPGTKGGSFLSTSENIQINGKDEFKDIIAPNVNIGFRVVISYGMIGVQDK